MQDRHLIKVVSIVRSIKFTPEEEKESCCGELIESEVNCCFKCVRNLNNLLCYDNQCCVDTRNF